MYSVVRISLVVYVLLYAVAASATTEKRCTDLSTDCKGGEPLNTLTVNSGQTVNQRCTDQSSGAVCTMDPDDSPNGTEYGAGGGNSAENTFPSTMTFVAESSSLLPVGSAVNYVLRRSGPNVGQLGVNSMDEVKNTTYCERVYRRWDTTSSIPDLGTPTANSQYKIMTIGGKSPKVCQGGANSLVECVDASTCAGAACDITENPVLQLMAVNTGFIQTRSDGLWFDFPVSFDGVGYMQDCVNNYCRFEMCLDHASDGYAAARFRKVEIAPSANAGRCYTYTKPKSGRHRETATFSGAVDIGFYNQNVPTLPALGQTIVYASYAMAAKHTPASVPAAYNVGTVTSQCQDGNNWWIGPSYEFEGLVASPQVSCTTNSPRTTTQSFAMTITPTDFTGSTPVWKYDLNNDGVANFCSATQGTPHEGGTQTGTCTASTSCTCTSATPSGLTAGNKTLGCSLSVTSPTESDTGTAFHAVTAASLACSSSPSIITQNGSYSITSTPSNFTGTMTSTNYLFDMNDSGAPGGTCVAEGGTVSGTCDATHPCTCTIGTSSFSPTTGTKTLDCGTSATSPTESASSTTSLLVNPISARSVACQAESPNTSGDTFDFLATPTGFTGTVDYEFDCNDDDALTAISGAGAGNDSNCEEEGGTAGTCNNTSCTCVCPTGLSIATHQIGCAVSATSPTEASITNTSTLVVNASNGIPGTLICENNGPISPGDGFVLSARAVDTTIPSATFTWDLDDDGVLHSCATEGGVESGTCDDATGPCICTKATSSFASGIRTLDCNVVTVPNWYTDAFTVDDLSSNWTQDSGTWTIGSGKLDGGNGGGGDPTYNRIRYTGQATSGTDQFVKFQRTNAFDIFGVSFRNSGATDPYYLVRFAGQLGAIWMRADENVVSQTIDSGGALAFGIGWYGITVEGTGNNTIVKVWSWPTDPDLGGVPTLANWGDPKATFISNPSSAVDTGNYVGLHSHSIQNQFDNFTAGSLSDLTGNLVELETTTDLSISSAGVRGVSIGGGVSIR